jgi:hypothetical protein
MRNKPNRAGRDARHCGLRIWDWGFREAGAGRSFSAAPNKPNHPICRGVQSPEALHIVGGERPAKNKANPGRGGLGIDDGLSIIDDLGKAMAVAAGGDLYPPVRQTKPICLFWLHRGHEMRDTLHEIRVHRVDAVPNKANRHARGPRLGISDWGFGDECGRRAGRDSWGWACDHPDRVAAVVVAVCGSLHTA